MIGRARTEDEMLAEALGQIVVSLDCEAGAIYMVSDDPSRLTLVAAAGNAPPNGGPPATVGRWCCQPPPAGCPVNSRRRCKHRPWRTRHSPGWLPSRQLPTVCWGGSAWQIPAAATWRRSRRKCCVLWVFSSAWRLNACAHTKPWNASWPDEPRWAALYQVSVALAQSSDDAGLLQEIVRSSVDLAGRGGGALILHDAAGDDLVVTVVHGSHLSMSEMVGKRFRPGEGISGQAILSRKPIILDSYAAWPGSLPELG